jgi:hypothetical protein
MAKIQIKNVHDGLSKIDIKAENTIMRKTL